MNFVRQMAFTHALSVLQCVTSAISLPFALRVFINDVMSALCLPLTSRLCFVPNWCHVRAFVSHWYAKWIKVARQSHFCFNKCLVFHRAAVAGSSSLRAWHMNFKILKRHLAWELSFSFRILTRPMHVKCRHANNLRVKIYHAKIEIVIEWKLTRFYLMYRHIDNTVVFLSFLVFIICMTSWFSYIYSPSYTLWYRRWSHVTQGCCLHA